MGVVLIDQVPFKHDLSKPQLSAARGLIKDCRETTNAKAALLREAIGVGDIEQQAQLHAILTESSDAIIASAITANRKLAAYLKSDDLPVTAIETPGLHTWPVWRDNLVNFAPLLFQSK